MGTSLRIEKRSFYYNFLINELNNCSLGGDFRVSRHAEICKFDRFSLEINFKRARSCNYGIPRLVQVKMKILYFNTLYNVCSVHRVIPWAHRGDIMIHVGEQVDKSLWFILKTQMYWTSPDLLIIFPLRNHGIPLMYSWYLPIPMYWWYPPTYWTSPDVLMVSPRCTEHTSYKVIKFWIQFPLQQSGNAFSLPRLFRQITF